MPNRPEFKHEGTGRNKGVLRLIRASKRLEAEERNRNSDPDNRRSFWRERGFTRKSEARRYVWGTVMEINDLARDHKQRSADWPMIKDELPDLA